MKLFKHMTAEGWLTAGLALLGILGLIFMSQLVAEPKVLFGRSLTAIPPSLFPSLTLGAMAVLACALLYSLRDTLLSREVRETEAGSIARVVLLFAVMLFYALAMGPIGFFFSSALSLAAVAWLAGNRSILQICLVSIVPPVVLYLVATRGLAVSLPELSSIEFIYARILDGAPSVPVEAQDTQ